ncbi:protein DETOXIFICATION 44, chloroplastic-like [Gossypium australe]|uniref:Protein DETOXIFICATION 44, chloroplastic-like n=1 Tax=Gossypium australe TaxID=47621 RepID=A0A5B6UYE1_9ROSI|nr:protein DETOXIFICATION 44, chloroplastic-like [Gossypium australe]
MTVTEYEREFVWLSKYAREYVSTEEIMCKWFIDGLKKDIKLLVGILELKEFVVLVDRACKAEELSKEKRRQIQRQDTREKDRRREAIEKCGNVTSSRGATKDSAKESEARAPTRAYAICAREDASLPDVIAGTFSLYDTNVISLIDPISTHSYVCWNLVSSKKLPVEYTEFVIKVSNPLNKYVLVDKVCKNCPLMTRGYCFSANLMLLPFDEFDVILGMDWLTLYDAIVNCRRKTIELKCQNNEIL